MTETLDEKQKRILVFHPSVPIGPFGDPPRDIRAEYQQIFNEMPPEMREAALNHYGRGGTFVVAEKVRLVDPSLSPRYLGFSRGDPPRTIVQYTVGGDEKTVRSFDDLKRLVHHEIGHAVFSDYADRINPSRNIRELAAKVFEEELKALGHSPSNKMVSDYYLPGPLSGGKMIGAAKEAMCEIISAINSGDITNHSFSRRDGRIINIREDFPRTYALAMEAIQGYTAANIADPAGGRRAAPEIIGPATDTKPKLNATNP